jgi:hypothetical protein
MSIGYKRQFFKQFLFGCEERICPVKHKTAKFYAIGPIKSAKQVKTRVLKPFTTFFGLE